MNVELLPHAADRQKLLTRLLDAVKQCQVRFGGKGELATENDSRVSVLCTAWESVLQHGMRSSNKALSALKGQVSKFTNGVFGDFGGMDAEPVFWHYIREHLSKPDIERFVLLKKITTDSGRGRAWLRSTLNEHSLERVMHSCLENNKFRNQYYEEWAFVRDHERSSMLPSMAAGLGSIVFAITIDSSDLNKSLNALASAAITVNRQSLSSTAAAAAAGSSQTGLSALIGLPQPRSEPKPVIAVPEAGSTGEHKPRRMPATFVSFDNDTKPDTEAPGSSAQVVRSVSSASVLSAGSGTSENSEDVEGDPSFTPLDSTGVPIFFKTEDDIQSVDSDLPTYSSSWTDDAMNAVSMATNASSSSLQSRVRGNVPSAVPESGEPAATMSAVELKQAIITMMMKKDEVEEQNKVLRSMLDQEIEMTKGLRAEITEMKVTHEDEQKRDQQRIQSLTKECELLKHQLKKYVNAVQALRRDGAYAEDLTSLGIHLDEPQPPLPAPKVTSEDYSMEADEYRRKLVQVAEMHGELMEFNEYLQKQVIVRDARISRLRETLVELRGPLPHDVQLDVMHSDDVSINWRPLVNIWIPSAFMKGSSKSIYHVYQVFVRIRDQEWNVYRRYSEFYDFHAKLKKRYPLLITFDFPPKKSIGNKDNKFVEERRKKLQEYMRKAVLHVLEHDSELQTADMGKLKFSTLLPFFSDAARAEKGSKKSQSSTRRSSKAAPSATAAVTAPASARATAASLGSTPDRYSGL